MNRRIGQLFSIILLSCSSGLSLLGCNNQTSNESSSSETTIRVLNLEDYIYLHDEESGYLEDDMVVQFEKYKKEQGEAVHVIYETSDTNETIYNDLKTGRTQYDLVCTSEYMLQKFVREGMLQKLHVDTSEDDWLANYHKYASPYIQSRLAGISVSMNDGTTEYLKDYAIGYMWGTLGILFNPDYPTFNEKTNPLNDMADWSVFWDSNYKGTISIKDSMRDVYVSAIMYLYSYEQFIEKDSNGNIIDKYTLYELKDRYDKSSIDAETYNSKISKVFNAIDDETLEKVSKVLDDLKANIFGLEIDSGKQDIVTGKIGVNLAWSGDAVYSQDQAEEETENTLYYSVPNNGSNIWFDGWVIPKNDNRTEAEYKLIHEFLNFISDPVNASQNMDYTGYTPYIGGDQTFDLVRDWYDSRTDLIYYYDEKNDIYYDLYYYDPSTGEKCTVWYEDCHYEEDNDPEYDYVSLFYEINEAEIDYGMYNTDLLIDSLVPDGMDKLIEVDLTYFFAGTLDEYASDSIVIYTDYYTEDNGAVGKQLFTQFPSEEVMTRCAIMADYGDQNTKVLKMWEEFKSNSLPLWATILLIVEVCLAAVLIIYFIINKHIKKKLHNNQFR